MEDTKELEAIGEDFAVSLSDLTINSRPIISTLTMIAQENINAAPYITKAVEKRIEKAIPSQKLYTFYLLDSISKNVGSPYTLLFGNKLYETYTKAYLLVDDNTRKKMIDLFKTWKSATTTSGLPLFPEEPINKIEQFLIKASSVYQHVQPPPPQQQQQRQQQQFRQQPQQLYQHSLIPAMDKAIYLANQKLSQSPDDQKTRTILQIITDMKDVFQKEQIADTVVTQCRAQIEDLTRQLEQSLTRTPTPTLPVPNLNNILHTVGAPTPQPQPAQQKKIVGNPLGLSSSLSNILIKTPPSNSGAKTNVSSLLANLAKSGVVKPKVPSTSALSSILAKASISTSTPPPQQKPSSELAAYDISAKFLQLDPSETYTALLITAKPHKCGQCGKRFSNTPEAQQKSRAHLDWHFRVNKKLRESQAMSRNWFLDDVEFVEFRDAEVFGDVKDVGKMVKPVIKKERKYVVVPADSEMSCVCGVCKEVMKARFDDDLGEWIWEGAVMKNGKVFHETCFSETQGSSALSGLLGLNKRPREETKLDLASLAKLQSIVKSAKLEDAK